MDLFLSPNIIESTVLLSPDGVAHYQVKTHKSDSGKKVSLIQNREGIVVAEITWKTFTKPTMIKCLHIGCSSSGKALETPASQFLYKRNLGGHSRCFHANDGLEYCWKQVKTVGLVLSCTTTSREIARYAIVNAGESGLFAGERRFQLQIDVSSGVFVDLIVVTFLIMERKRREKRGEYIAAHEEDPLGEGGGEGEG